MNTLFQYLQFPFVRYAIIVGTLIALCSSLLGVVLVLKRFSFIGDALSHVAFGAMAVAGVAGLTNETIIVLPVTIIAAIILLKRNRVNNDAVTAMISVGTLAFGYMFINLFSKSGNVSADVCSVLFGSTSILTLSVTDVWVCIILSVVVITLFYVFYRKIFAITFDETFAKATGTKTELYNTMIATVIASVIVLAMNLVGSLLVSALIIFPALSAMKVQKSFKGVTILSAVFSVVCALSGLIFSILLGTPVGSTIVIADTICFVICLIISKIK